MNIIPDDNANPMNRFLDGHLGRRADIKLFDRVPEIVCFDMFGTVINSLESDRAAIKRILGRDIQFPLSNGKSLWNSFGDFVGPENAEAAKTQYIMELQTNILNGTAKPFDRVDMVMNLLFALGSKVVIITNRDARAVMPLLFKYPEVFRFVTAIGYTKDENLPQKPDPQSFIKTLAKAGLKPTENMMMIGDAVSDITYARDCDMTPVMFGYNADHNTPKYQKENRDIYQLHSYHLLDQILQSKFPGGYAEYEQEFRAQAQKNWAHRADEIYIEGYNEHGYTNNQFANLTPHGERVLTAMKLQRAQQAKSAARPGRK
ncbi:MAG: HAD-IA family hydrolase [Rickettsiales bacterium]|jgi:HAD superfamily hydrolase (TIGR01549 family)|nr:HAD-IA family hydrolase [Rickettsiales bacterium]